jgi:hypothetical protein
MSKRTRAFILAAIVAATNLAAMTAVAQAQANDQPARRPPSQSQVGESWRHQTDVPAQPVEPGRLPSWVKASLGLLAAVLALSGGLAVLAARRAGRRARVGHPT